MAGRARLNALRDELEKRTRDYFDVDPVNIAMGTEHVPSHLDYVCARIESGTTAKTLAKELSDPLGYELTYERLARYLRDTFGPERVANALDEARIRASHCYAEEALEIVDAPAYDSVTVQQARARANQRNWMAERYNPSRFGGQKGVSVNVSIGSLHLDALRSRPAEVTGMPASTGGMLTSHMTSIPQAVDAEVLSVSRSE